VADPRMKSDEERAKRYNEEQSRYDAGMPSPKAAEEMRKQAEDKRQQSAMQQAYDKAVKDKYKYAKGGGVTRADGCVTKGHTRGRMV